MIVRLNYGILYHASIRGTVRLKDLSPRKQMRLPVVNRLDGVNFCPSKGHNRQLFFPNTYSIHQQPLVFIITSSSCLGVRFCE
ncbi:MAG: hypothetical protein FWD36_06940 [Treponema sp.]|nr:hypothetical protein [Treponema sp.]